MAKNRMKNPKVQTGSQPGKYSVRASGGPLLNDLWLAILLGVISFLVYANTIGNGFVLDDSVMLVHNNFVQKGFAGIPELFSTPHQRGFWEIPNDEYRPLPLVLLAMIYQFFSLNPAPYHFVNVLLFAGCVVLLFRFLDALFEGKKTAVAFMASLLFALHPIHTEIVANIKSNDELLCFFFAFLAMNVFVRYNQSGKVNHLVAGLTCFFLAFLSKETVITFLAVVPLVFLVYLKENRKRSLHIITGAVAVSVLFIAIRVLILRYHHADSLTKVDIVENALAKEGLLVESRMATAVLIMGYYLKLLFVPYPLVCDYSFNAIPFVHFSNPGVLLSLAAYALLAVACVVLFFKNRRSPYLFGISFFLVTAVLFSNVLFLFKSTMGERFMFFPSVGFCLVIALAVERFLGGKEAGSRPLLQQKPVVVLLVVVSLVYAAMTINRNSEWQDNYTLFKADIPKAPENSRLNYMLAYDMFSAAKRERNPVQQRQIVEEAIVYFRKAVAIYPGYYFAHADLGAAYFFKGQFDSAEVYDRNALQLFPEAVVARNNLSGVLIKRLKFADDVVFCRQSIEMSNTNIYAYSDVGYSYFNLGNYDSSLYYLHKRIEIDPKFYPFYEVLSNVYNKLGKPDSAKMYQSIAYQLSQGGN